MTTKSTGKSTGSKGKKTEAEDEFSYEQVTEQLEVLIEKLESEQTDLADSLTCFEEGVALIRKAQAALDSAEQRVQLLLERDGAVEAVDFSEDEDPE